MSKSTFGRFLRNREGSRRAARPDRRAVRFTGLELMDRRLLPAVTAAFNPAAGLLTVIGDPQANTIVVSRNAAGTILVNGGGVTVQGGSPTVANTTLVQLFGLGGSDNLRLDETNGALPKANIFGGDGNDIITGGSGDDQLFGQSGNDTLLGKGGNDVLVGGDGDDVLTGGVGADQVFGQSGNDRMIWNPGDGSDLNEGGDGIDTVEVNGGNGAETFTTTANGTRVRFDRTDPAPFFLDIGTSENLVLNANGGDDSFTAGNGLANLIQITVDGGTGSDTLRGGDGNDVLMGGDGNDLINGGRGNDLALLGAGDDTFVWNPGDGSDTVEGQSGHDTMQFNGSNVNEKIDLSANGSRLRLVRDVGAVTMDVNGVEQVNVSALGGADTVTVNNLLNIGVTGVSLDLAGMPGSGTGDGQTDTVIVTGTARSDAIQISGGGTSFAVAGLPALVTVQGSDGVGDQLVVHALGGDDKVTAAGLPATLVGLTVDGGTGNDSITGGDGNDTLLGGDGNDTVIGGRGNDVAFLGAGNDTFVWNPGDGSDVVEGQDGHDTMVFNGSNLNENIDLSADGSRLRLVRDVGGVTMDVSGVEQVNVAALGGADTLTVNDLSGTDVTRVSLDLAGTPGSGTGDGQADSVIVNGSNNGERIVVAGSASGINVSGLAASLHIAAIDASIDRLAVNALAGDDTIDASALHANAIVLSLNGGEGADMLIGSQGNDLIVGGRGSDIASMGAGNDTFVWNPGDGSDTVEGQSGVDTMQFNGANIDEKIDVSANGSRVRLTRDVGNITMDFNGIEQINVNALGGADTVTVNDLTGTGVSAVNVDLAATPGTGTGDGQADSVIVNGTNGNDAIIVVGDASGVAVLGLAAQVDITGAEPANDRLTVNTLGGDDVLDATGVSDGAILLAANGSDGNDILIGGAGNDTLTGGAGDDILIGGPGLDVLDGGPGDNTLFQD
jgi:Ca2+-binding RTX toxin-like protein